MPQYEGLFTDFNQVNYHTIVMLDTSNYMFVVKQSIHFIEGQTNYNYMEDVLIISDQWDGIRSYFEKIMEFYKKHHQKIELTYELLYTNYQQIADIKKLIEDWNSKQKE